MKNLLSALLLTLFSLTAGAQTEDSHIRLEKAKEYFTAEKYHESLIEFQKLDEEYNLSTHYYAYMALCFYKDNQYEKACAYYGKAAKYLEVCAPSEKSLYYYTLADSHFKLSEYIDAKNCFEKVLDVCHEREKADVYYHIGFCQFFTNENEGAMHSFRMSLKYYRENAHETGTEARISQLEKMIGGLDKQLNDNSTKKNETKH